MANDMNHLAVIGRLTRDAEIKFSSVGSAIVNFSIAINRSRKIQGEWVDEASFFDVTAFGKIGESLKPYLTKGKQVAIEGYLKQDRWDKQDGSKGSKVIICAENMQLLGGSSREEGASYAEQTGYGYGYGQ